MSIPFTFLLPPSHVHIAYKIQYNIGPNQEYHDTIPSHVLYNIKT